MTMAVPYELSDPKARMSDLVQEAMLREDVTISKEHGSLVKDVAVIPTRRKPGTGKGVRMSLDFDAPLSDFAEYM